MWSFVMRRVRLYRLDRNPLRRRWDRIEAAVVVVLLLFWLAGFAVALVAGARVMSAGRAQSHAGHWVNAQLVVDAPAASTSVYRQPRTTALVRWQESGRPVVTAPAPVLWGMKAGDPVKVWLDSTGRPAVEPPGEAEIAFQTLLTYLAVIVVVTTVLHLAYGVARRILDRGRVAEWANDWIAADARWRGPKRLGP